MDLTGFLNDVLKILSGVIRDLDVGWTVGFTNELDLLRCISSYIIAHISCGSNLDDKSDSTNQRASSGRLRIRPREGGPLIEAYWSDIYRLGNRVGWDIRISVYKIDRDQLQTVDR